MRFRLQIDIKTVGETQPCLNHHCTPKEARAEVPPSEYACHNEIRFFHPCRASIELYGSRFQRKEESNRKRRWKPQLRFVRIGSSHLWKSFALSRANNTVPGFWKVIEAALEKDLYSLSSMKPESTKPTQSIRHNSKAWKNPEKAYLRKNDDAEDTGRNAIFSRLEVRCDGGGVAVSGH